MGSVILNMADEISVNESSLPPPPFFFFFFPFLLVFPPHWEIQEYFVYMLQCILTFSFLSSVARDSCILALSYTHILRSEIKRYFHFFHREEGSGVFPLWDFQLSLTQGHWSKRFGKSEIVQTPAVFGV